jgi:hypothetical protein
VRRIPTVAPSSASSLPRGIDLPSASFSDVKSRMFGSSIGSRPSIRRFRGKLAVD